MEAEPTPETRARTPLAAASTRLRGLLRHPFALRTLVIGGLAVAGWLLGAGGASAAVTPAADAVTGQAGESVHTGAVHRAVGSPHRPGRPDDESAVGGPVRRKAGGLVHSGREVAGHAAGRLDRGPIAEKAYRIGGPVRHVARRIDGPAPRPAEGPDTQAAHRVTTPVTSLLGDGTTETGALGTSSITRSMTRDVPSRAPTPAAAMREGGVRAARTADASPSGTPAAYRTAESLTAGMPRPALGRPSRPRTTCPRSAMACGHGTGPHAPAVPAPTGPASGSHGVAPPPAPGPILAADLARAHPGHPRRTPAVPTRRGVLPPVVRTAADEPALSPD